MTKTELIRYGDLLFADRNQSIRHVDCLQHAGIRIIELLVRQHTPLDVTARCFLFQPVKVIGQIVSLKTADDGIPEFCPVQERRQRASIVQYQMLTPERKLLELFEIQVGKEEIIGMGYLDDYFATRFQLAVGDIQQIERISEMFEDMEESDDVEFIGRYFGNVAVSLVILVPQGLQCPFLRLHRDGGIRKRSEQVQNTTGSGAHVQPGLVTDEREKLL